MNVFSKTILSFILFKIIFLTVVTAQQKRIVVSSDGKGDFKSIQAALVSLPDTSFDTRIIFIKKGVYKEKIYIEKHNIILEGEEREGVTIKAPIAREEWRCFHHDDWGVATVNIDGNDITFKNLTIINSFGFEWTKDKTIFCPTDTSRHPYKVIHRTGHQMAVRTIKATRFKAVNCVFRSYAGDTMSPWNTANGMFYFKDCIMEGGVDLYCPRGWAYAEDCKFIATHGTAAIWHDGSLSEDSKTVLKNCVFEGHNGFHLGRYHRDAQFYLINCTFAHNMADRPIERIHTKNTIKWGHRVYYYNCHRVGGNFTWFKNNIETSKSNVSPENISPSWVFGEKWSPDKN